MAVFKIDASEVPLSVAGGGDLRERLDFKSEQAKLSPSGKPTFRSGADVRRDGGFGGFDHNASIAVCEEPKEPWPFGTVLTAEGDAWVTPYVTDGNRQGLSFVVDRLVPSAPTPPAPKKFD